MIRYGFFNSVSGDRKYNADDMTKYFEGIVSDGVFKDVEYAMKATTSMQGSFSVDILPGKAFINCRWLTNNAEYTLTFDSPEATLDRIDSIVIRYDGREESRKMEIAIVKGTPSANPVPPARQKTKILSELVIAYVRIRKGATSIETDDITDMRYSDLCGWVHSLIGGSGSTGTLRRYNNRKILTGDTNIVYPGISQYTHGDALDVYINGLKAIEGLDYTLSGEGSSASVVFSGTLEAGNTVSFVLTRIE